MKEKIRPVARQSLADDLAQRIRRLIRENRLKRGQRLPPIAEMAKRFGVGHPTLRESLRKLEALGIVDIRHGSGVYVKDETGLLVTNPIHETRVSKKLLLDLVEAREPVELKSVQLAARSVTQEQLEEMHATLATAASSFGDPAALTAANMRFHLEIAKASGNSVVFELLKVLSALFQNEQRIVLDIHGSPRVDLAEHRAMLEALERRDEAEAVALMRAHLAGVRQAIENWDALIDPVE